MSMMSQSDAMHQTSMSRLYDDQKKEYDEEEEDYSDEGADVERVCFGEKWKSLSEMKTPRVGCAAVSVSSGRYLIVVGGRSSATGETLSTAEGFDFEDPDESWEWTTISRRMTTARSFCCAAAVETTLSTPLVVVMGGQNAEGKALSDVESLDLQTHRWRRLPNMNVRRTKCACVVIRSRRIVVLGGQDETGRPLDSCEYLDLDFTRRPRWILMGGGDSGGAGGAGKARFVGGVGKSSLAAVVTGEGDLLALGGATLEIQVLIHDEWKLLPKQLWLSSLRNRCQVVPVGTSTICVLGGSSGGRAGATASVEALDLMQLAWTQPPPPRMKTPRHSFAAATMDNRRIVVVGGYDNANQALASVEVLEVQVLPPEGVNEEEDEEEEPEPLPPPESSPSPPPQPDPQPEPEPEPVPASNPPSSSLQPAPAPQRPQWARSSRRRGSSGEGGGKGMSLAQVVCESMNSEDHMNAASSLRLQSARATALQQEANTPPNHQRRAVVPAVHAKAIAPLPGHEEHDEEYDGEGSFGSVGGTVSSSSSSPVPRRTPVTPTPPMLVLPALPPPPPPLVAAAPSMRSSPMDPSRETANAIAESRARAAELEAWSEKVRKLTEGVQHMTAIHMEECVAQRDDEQQQPAARRRPKAEETFQRSIRHIQSNAGNWTVRAQQALESVELELETIYESMDRPVKPRYVSSWQKRQDIQWEPSTPPPSRPTKPRPAVRSRSSGSSSSSTTTTTTTSLPPPPLPTTTTRATMRAISMDTTMGSMSSSSSAAAPTRATSFDTATTTTTTTRSAKKEEEEEDATDAEAADLPIPKDLLCPLTGRLMKDPVIASDGFTYERSAMEQWISMHLASSPLVLSPSTEKELSSTTLIPNLVLQSLIRSYQVHVLAKRRRRRGIDTVEADGGGGDGGGV